MATATKFTLREDVYSGDKLHVDRENGVIRNVRILGEQSKNGRRYTAQARQQACSLYEGVHVHIDHPRDEQQLDRNFGDWFGTLENCRALQDGVYGNMPFLKAHPMAEAICEQAERFPRHFGLSHVAIGHVETSGGEEIVESIDEVDSVDLVRRPATNQGLFESQREPTVSKTTLQELFKKHRTRKKDAKRLAALLEMEDFADAASDEVALEPTASVDDEMKAGIEAMVLAVIRDDDLDASGKVNKIKQILNAQEKIAEKPDASSGDGGGSGEGSETMESIQKTIDRLERRDTLRSILDEAELRMSDIPPAQRKLLERQTDEEGMREVIETFVESMGPRLHQPSGRRRQPVRVGSARESDDNTSYDKLKEQVRRKRRRRA